MQKDTKQFEKLYSQLNTGQKIAVDHIDGPMIVLAGPGTGKTQIIAVRIAKILQETQMDPQNILCLTFTESGVVAMRKRLLSIIGTAAYYVRICTFHSFCNDIIAQHPETFMFAKELESLTEIECYLIIRELLDELPVSSPLKPFGDPYLYKKDVKSAIQNLKRENVSPEDFKKVLDKEAHFWNEFGARIQSFTEIHGRTLKEEDILNLINELGSCPLSPLFKNFIENEADGKERAKERTKLKSLIKKIMETKQKMIPKQMELLKIYKRYGEELKKRGRYDFDDMIAFVIKKFKEDSELLASYREQFQYILVDEYQDTNGVQNMTVSMLGDFFESPNIFVVGDDKQSIYRFQGASLENILYFRDKYGDKAEMVALTDNYRSTQIILDASHSLIENNSQGLKNLMEGGEPRLVAARPAFAQDSAKTDKIILAEFENDHSENFYLSHEIKKLIETGTDPSEIAIIYRNHRDADDIIDIFLASDIPFHLEAGEDVLKDNLIGKLILILEFLSDFEDDNKFFHMLHLDFLNLNLLDVAKLTRFAHKSHLSIFETMNDADKLAEMNFAEPEKLLELGSKLLVWQAESFNKTFTEFIDILIRECGILDYILKKTDKIEHLNRLNSFFDVIKTLNRSNHKLTNKEFLEYLRLHLENDVKITAHELQTKKDAIQMMTAHKSKGLEFEHVFIIKCVDKHWGNTTNRDKLPLPDGILMVETSNDLKERNEDERRLFYVAMTRAKNSVHLSYAKKSKNDKDQVPSIFIEEIQDDLLEELETEGIENLAMEHLETYFEKPKEKNIDEEETAFIKGLLENYTLSVTHLNNYLRCPRIFYFQNLLRAPASKNKHASFGSAVHFALHSFSSDIKSGAQPSKETLINTFDKYLKREVLSDKDFKMCMELGHQTLSDYFDHYKQNFTPDQITEYDFSTHGVNLDGIPLTGKLDKIEILDKSAKTVNVVDYKTGNPDSKNKALIDEGEYKRQIVFYQLLCDLSPVFPYKMVSGEIDFIQKSTKSNTFKKHKFVVTKEELDNLKTTIKSVYSEIQNLEFLNPDEWKTCGECEYCLARN